MTEWPMRVFRLLCCSDDMELTATFGAQTAIWPKRAGFLRQGHSPFSDTSPPRDLLPLDPPAAGGSSCWRSRGGEVSEKGLCPCRRIFFFEFSRTGFYAILLRKTTCGQKPEPGVWSIPWGAEGI